MKESESDLREHMTKPLVLGFNPHLRRSVLAARSCSSRTRSAERVTRARGSSGFRSRFWMENGESFTSGVLSSIGAAQRWWWRWMMNKVSPVWSEKRKRGSIREELTRSAASCRHDEARERKFVSVFVCVREREREWCVVCCVCSERTSCCVRERERESVCVWCVWEERECVCVLWWGVRVCVRERGVCVCVCVCV